MTVSFCCPWIFFEQTNYMMIDPRKLPNNTTAAPTELILATPPSSDLLLVFSWLALFSRWNWSRFLFLLLASSRCRKSIKEIIVSVFHWRDDPRQQMSVCFTISITTFDLEQIRVTEQSSPSHGCIHCSIHSIN